MFGGGGGGGEGGGSENIIIVVDSFLISRRKYCGYSIEAPLLISTHNIWINNIQEVPGTFYAKFEKEDSYSVLCEY